MFQSLFAASRLIAIIRLEDLTHATELSRALLDGGIVLQEYTLTNPRALDALSAVRSAIPAFQNGTAAIGIGSIRTEQQSRDAISAGAQFLVTPTLNPAVIECCNSHSIPIASGAMTPTEILHAWELGSDIVKLFPARGLGPDYIRDCLAPLPDIRLLPTGGIDLTNMQAYLQAGAAGVGVGGNLIDQQALANQDWRQLSEVARRYTEAAKP